MTPMNYNYLVNRGVVIDPCETLTGADVTVTGSGTITQTADGWRFSAGDNVRLDSTPS